MPGTRRWADNSWPCLEASCPLPVVFEIVQNRLYGHADVVQAMLRRTGAHEGLHPLPSQTCWPPAGCPPCLPFLSRSTHEAHRAPASSLMAEAAV